MNINFKITNKNFIFILIIIILLSLLFSCNNSDVVEGLTSQCTTERVSASLAAGLPPYGNNSDGFWYDISCASSSNLSFALIPGPNESIIDSRDISCIDISDGSFNSYFTTGEFNGYHTINNNSSIRFIKINTSNTPTTIIFNCSGLSSSNGITWNNRTIYPQFFTGNIINSFAQNNNLQILKYPDDFQISDPQTSNSDNSTEQTSNQVTQTQSAVNVNVDTSNPLGSTGATSLNPATTNNTTNVINPTTGLLTPGQTLNNSALLLQQPVNSVLTSAQPNFMETVENGFNTLFGSGGSDSTLLMNNIDSINDNSTTPSTIFTTQDGRQGIATPDNTVNGIPSSQIPQGQQDLYILKSQVVPPVCPACPPVIVDKNTLKQDCPPCPPCARCPEPNFDCKKVPNYSLGPENSFLPRPVLNDFSTFGM